MIAEHPAPRGCIADPKSVTSPTAAARQGRLSSAAGPPRPAVSLVEVTRPDHKHKQMSGGAAGSAALVGV